MAARVTAFVVFLIVAASVVAGLIVGAQRDDVDGPVDLLILNGKVFTADAAGTVAEALAIQGSKILRVGPEREIKRLRRRQTTVIDARGGTVLPGFNDAHVHLFSGGLALDKVNLLDATTLAQIEQRIVAFAEAHPERRWVQGRGWYYEPFPGGLPTRDILDRLVPDRPAHMVAYDGHTAWVNSKALELAGIIARTPSPKNGEIVRDPRTGEPTGVLKEAAMGLVSKVLPEATPADRVRALRAAIREAHRVGVTSVQNAGGSTADFELFDEVRRSGDLRLRIYAALSAGAGLDAAALDELDAVWRRFPDDPLLKAGAIKLMVDGVVEGHTAAMLAPYANRPRVSGTPMMTAEDLTRVVALLDARGWQVMTHAIGDRGIRMVLDAYEHAARANPGPARGRRHRIEHIETTDPADVPRFGALGVVASMQPFHANPSPNQINVWMANIGPERSSRGWVYRSIQDGGGHLAFGSDWPVVNLDPRLGLHMAVTRTTPEGTPPGGWFPDQKMPLSRALKAYTSDAAWASFDENRKGILAPGMLADIVILSTNVLGASPATLLRADVATTIFDGKIVYSREAGGPSPEP
jgi:hypothetical protein